jgi:hypothetical protein
MANERTRVWQVTGTAKTSPEQRARAEWLVQTWLECGVRDRPCDGLIR